MQLFRAFIAVLARVLISLIFLISGVNQILYWKETEKRFLTVIADWQTYTVSSDFFQFIFRIFFQWSPIFLIVISALQMIGALFLLFGRNEKLGALLLIIVLIPTTLLVQHFWFSEANIKSLQLSFFLRDLAILGGLLVVVLRGTKERTSSSL